MEISARTIEEEKKKVAQPPVTFAGRENCAKEKEKDREKKDSEKKRIINQDKSRRKKSEICVLPFPFSSFNLFAMQNAK